MPDDHGLPGGVTLRLLDVERQTFRSLTDAFSGGLPPARPEAIVTVHGRQGGPPACSVVTGDAGDGRVVGKSAGGLVVTERSGWIEIAGGPAALDIGLGRSRPGWPVVREVIRPALQVAGLEAGVVVVHAAAVEIDGAAVVLAGWSESGKTETALALVEQGARFVGDKWTVLAPTPLTPVPAAAPERAATRAATMVGPFPSRVGIRDWVVPYLPRLASRLGFGGRARLRVGQAAARFGQVVSGLAGIHPASATLVRPAVQLSSLAATIRMTADEVREVYGQDVPGPDLPLGGVFVLTTTGPGAPIGIERADPVLQADRLAASAAFERRAYHLLGQRAAALGAGAVPGFDIVPKEAQALVARFDSAPVFEVRVPFPADPFVAADLIRGSL